MVEESNRNINRKIASLLISVIILLAPCSVTVFAADVFTYDENGNMVSDGVYCYEYNDANQLSRVRDCASDQLIAEYLYDHSGARAVKKQYEGGVLQHTTYYIGDLFETKLYPDGSTENTSYYFVNGERVARKDPDGSMHYYHGDHLGSTSVVTDSTGNLEEKTKYYPYGLVRAGGTESKYLFTGQEKDSETGLYYYGARYYNPEIMRFAQPDPILPNVYDPQSLNRYSYVKNNPVKYVDPTGNNPAILLPILGYLAILVAAPDLAQDAAWVVDDVRSGDYEGAAYGVVGMGLPVVSGKMVKGARKFKIGKALDWVKSKIDDILGRGGKEVVEQGIRYVNPKDIKFSHKKFSRNFYDKETGEVTGTVNDLITKLKSGEIKPSDIPSIQVAEYQGKWVSKDNRRLFAFQQAGIEDIPVEVITKENNPAVWNNLMRKLKESGSPLDSATMRQ